LRRRIRKPQATAPCTQAALSLLTPGTFFPPLFVFINFSGYTFILLFVSRYLRAQAPSTACRPRCSRRHGSDDTPASPLDSSQLESGSDHNDLGYHTRSRFAEIRAAKIELSHLNSYTYPRSHNATRWVYILSDASLFFNNIVGLSFISIIFFVFSSGECQVAGLFQGGGAPDLHRILSLHYLARFVKRQLVPFSAGYTDCTNFMPFGLRNLRRRI